MKISNVEFNVDALSGTTREEFISVYKGKLKADINYAADLLDRYFKKEEVVLERLQNESQEDKPKRRRKRK